MCIRDSYWDCYNGFRNFKNPDKENELSATVEDVEQMCIRDSPIGMWGRLHRTYLEQDRPARFSALCLSGELHTYLADLNEQATERCSLIICLLYTSRCV